MKDDCPGFSFAFNLQAKNAANKISAASAAFQAFWPKAKTLPQGESTSPEDVK